MPGQKSYIISLINLCFIEEINIYGFKIVKFNIYKIKYSYYLLEKNQKHGINWYGGTTTIILALKRLRQEDCELEVSLDYIVSMIHLSQNKRKQNNKKRSKDQKQNFKTR